MKTFYDTQDQKPLQYFFHAMENCYHTSDQLASVLRHISASHQTGLPFWKKAVLPTALLLQHK